MAKTNVKENALVRKHPASRVLWIIVIFMLIAGAILYPAYKSKYQAERENGRLAAEFEVLQERNEKIKQQIIALGTPEGIEDRAREIFDWVREGEQAVNIDGFDNLESSTDLPAPIAQGSGEVLKTWWIKLQDFIFGVKETEPINPYLDEIIPGL